MSCVINFTLAETITIMARKRKFQNQGRGKYKKRRPPINQWEKLEQSGTELVNNDNESDAASSSSPSIEGCRIVNIQLLQPFVEDISSHSSKCKRGSFSLIGESKRSGLASVLYAKCSRCHKKMPFSTSSKVHGLSGRKRWEVNLAAVWGQMATGGGHYPLREQLSVMGVPAMTKKSFTHTEETVGRWWFEILDKSMHEAAEEKRKIAVQNESMHDGVPAITVIVDGGWSKRSHKHSYNAKSGVGVVIGQATGKLLDLGVRNKYCSVCNTAENQQVPPSVHKCHKNWDGASSSMETDILVTAFQRAESKYGLRYMKYVGDGDSSVYPNLIASVPV